MDTVSGRNVRDTSTIRTGCLDFTSMPAMRSYRTRTRPTRTTETRARIVAAVHELLEEGTFHESTVEQVADRAGVARATVYQHFGSRLGLVDAICDTFAVNPALLRLRETVELEDPDAALSETIANCVTFWSSEDAVLSQLYGVVAIDPAAQELVDRQRRDRRGELVRLARHLERHERLRSGLAHERAVAILLMLTSYETFRELALTGMSNRTLTATLQDTAATLLLR